MIAIPREPAKFSPGQLVQHKRYKYRGLIVDYDDYCKAEEQWYQSNRTQPDRNQPWYHVLVDGSSTSTYAAEENLEPDTSDAPITHPLVDYFFEGFSDGSYIRNDRPWPS